jgi:hypothetical protein
MAVGASILSFLCDSNYMGLRIHDTIGRVIYQQN